MVYLRNAAICVVSGIYLAGFCLFMNAKWKTALLELCLLQNSEV